MNHMPSNAELTNLKLHLLAALNGVRIRRYEYDEFGRRVKVAQTMEVPIKYGHRTRQIHESIQINGQIRLPCISVTMTGISLDESRNESKKHNMVDKKWDGTDNFSVQKKPVPINLSFNMAIATTRGSDLEEILAHYLSVFNPYIQISWKEPFSNKELISKVVWDGNVGTELPTDTDSAEKIRYIANMGLTLEGWFYRGQEDDIGVIKTIEYDVGLIDNIDCDFFEAPITELPDTTVINGMPSFKEADSYCIKSGGSVSLWGESMNHIDALFISPITSNFPVTSYDPFFMSESLSSVGVFEGMIIDDYTLVNDNHIEFDIPEEVTEGTFDVIVMNRHCGINRLSENLSGDDCASPYINLV